MISQRFSATFARLRLLRAFATTVIALGLLFTHPSSAQEKNSIEFIELSGVIDPVASRFLLRQIGSAERNESQAVIVRLDTPGGLDISMREMVQRILSARVPIVVWVAPSGARAASAGVFITYASHVAAMAPGTNIGAAHPVNLGEPLDEVASTKATNDAAAYIRSIALLRGRNPEWAERAVRESVSIDAEGAASQGVVELIAPTLRAARAPEAVTTPRSLLEQLDGREVNVGGETVRLSTADATVRFHKMTLLERILHIAISPEVAYLLLLLGFYGLIFELYSPGIGAAGVLGGVALVLGFYALSILPTSWAGVALVLLAVAFFVIDLHTAGLGVFTLGGTVALIAGSLLLFAGADPELRLSWWAVGGALFATLAFFLWIMTAALRARGARPVSGAEAMVGTVGLARTDIAPEGQVMARGTLWRARTGGEAIPQGSQVRIRSVSGLMLVVEPLQEDAVRR
jgi:membrane-bound serine protease (ClpP class)